jgi:hypothetical protein
MSHIMLANRMPHLIFWANATAWKNRGAEFITEPIPKCGETGCYIRDPGGYVLEVGQSTELNYS